MNEEMLNSAPQPEELQGKLRTAVDAIRTLRPPEIDIIAWKTPDEGNIHHEEQESATPSPTTQRPHCSVQRRKRLSRVFVVATTAAVAVCVWLGLGVSPSKITGPAPMVFGDTLEQIQKAKTITWKTVFYEHITNKSETETWLRETTAECAYKAPGLRREVRFDENGQIEWTEITDWIHGRRLTCDPKKKTATIKEITPCHDPAGPFDYYEKKLRESNLQWIEKRKTATGEVNIFRNAYRDYANDRDCSADVWIDATTKQLVAAYNPGADIYDHEHDLASKESPKDTYCHYMMGGGERDIRFDTPLNDSLFSLEPPEGYAVEVKQRDHVTEQETIDYLGLVAEFNDQTFPDQLPTSPSLLKKRNETLKKQDKPETLTPVERKLLDIDMRYGWRFGTVSDAPIYVFFYWAEDSIVKDSFRYLGKGVTLGDKDRIVCWYKLKDAKDPNAYRVLYGDLTVKDVVAKDLPLPVEP